MSSDFLLQALILLGAIVLVVPLLQKVGAGSVAGYLVAGLLVGPPMPGWVTEYQLIGSIAEFGVVFLLFSIGIELRPARLWLMRRLVFGLGSAQLLLCGTAIGGALYLTGFTPAAAVVCGLALAAAALCALTIPACAQVIRHPPENADPPVTDQAPDDPWARKRDSDGNLILTPEQAQRRERELLAELERLRARHDASSTPPD